MKRMLPRPLLPASDDALPFYVQHQGTRVVKDGGVLRVLEREERLKEARLREVSQLAIYGGVQITTSVIRELCTREIPICYFSHGGWFYGITHGMFHKNVELRRRQYAAAQLKHSFCKTNDTTDRGFHGENAVAQLKREGGGSYSRTRDSVSTEKMPWPN